MNNTLLIAFNGGAYGTYLEWALNVLITDDPIKSPFTWVGNSHASQLGHHLIDIDGVSDLAMSRRACATARFHPKTQQSHRLKDNLLMALDRFNKMILLYPDRDHELLCINNFMSKIWVGIPYYQGAMSYANPKDIYGNYPIEPTVPLDDLPIWIKREHMSFNLFDSWRDQVEWYFLDSWMHDRCLIVTTKQLLFEFPATMAQIIDFWCVRIQRPIQDLLPYHQEMLSLQKNIDQDHLVKEILDSVLYDTGPKTWQQLPLPSEAWIQKKLREANIDLKCHGLEIFPTDTQSLLELCVRID